jgi:hypothetical protein
MLRPKAFSTLALITSYPRLCIGFRLTTNSFAAGRCLPYSFGASKLQLRYNNYHTDGTRRTCQASYLKMASEQGNSKSNNGGLFLFDFDGGEFTNDVHIKIESPKFSILNLASLFLLTYSMTCSCL